MWSQWRKAAKQQRLGSSGEIRFDSSTPFITTIECRTEMANVYFFILRLRISALKETHYYDLPKFPFKTSIK